MVLIHGQAVEGSCFEELDHVMKLLQRFCQETIVLCQCVCDGSVQVGHEVVYPGGSFCVVAQLPCQFLCLAYSESVTICVPGFVDDFANVIDVGGDQDGDGELVCVQKLDRDLSELALQPFPPICLEPAGIVGWQCQVLPSQQILPRLERQGPSS